MSPGPKKRRGQQPNKTNQTSKSESPSSKNGALKVESTAEGDIKVEDSLDSNWNRYDEPQDDTDGNRGTDYEVLLSYSAGAGSQLKLQEEQEWDEQRQDARLVLDLARLSKALKCVPFQDLIHVPSDVFNTSQLRRFEAFAQQSLYAFNSECKPPILKDTLEQVDDHSDFYTHSAQDVSDVFEPQSDALTEKAKDLIQSLTLGSSNTDEVLPSQPPVIEEKGVAENDDLDFLLSLSTKPEEKSKEIESKTEAVDDWLSELLDN